MGDLDKSKYAELKNLAYFTYDIYHKSSSEKAELLLQEFLKKFETDEEKKIFTNTLLCPFDIELYQDVMYGTPSQENILNIMVKFDITKEEFEDKVKEYDKYHFLNCVGEQLIDNNLTFELSKLFLQRQVENTEDSKKSIK